MKALSLISAGIDSPVASWLMIRRGVELIGIHFSNEPLSFSSPREKTIEICRHLGIKRLCVVKHGSLVQAELMRRCDNRMRCVLCRRMMFRIAEQIAVKEGCDFLVTGENLAQVASQTLENMTVAESGLKMKVIRPVLCNDKQETVDLAKRIGTYKLSVEASSCCNAVPRMPVTKARLADIEAEETKLDMESLVKEAVNTAQILSL